MNKDFTVIFEKLSDQTLADIQQEHDGAVMLSGESLIELDELAELRRVVTEIIDPEPMSFTTT